MSTSVNTLVLLGMPGAGKGTQGGILKERLRFSPIGYGEFFRRQAKNGGFAGQKIGETINKGNLLPYWIPAYVLINKLFEEIEPDQGIILDGAARTREEARILHEVLTWFERPYRAVYIDISDEVAIERLSARRELINRPDDEESHIRTRLEAYHSKVIPAIDFFREQGVLVEINGDQSMELVSEEIVSKLAGEGVRID